ncbi:protein NirF [Labrenzia sp. EL_208]|uniref:PQQ-dependent catabolism-associated beta-propeller protein n=1 Tax=Roseibium album TaxID=311410 RepID=A0A0M7A5Q4_9HYPH|nr:cytochrome D1 domain-containing protein [Roseibium album]MBG6160265.1 protein NirF [Labrenzia sp. EL_162]MBG6166300.1 protein NirF [Labrenzia sp. EL_195]MBG6178376.1 protein NirF [Labrenzia sp. EL_132]MBG6198797.1 protein NirF [Labrenzia sp. EL_159]MBG6205179.1 protein NirF [Labrenzia sp. EL_13]MBG6233047.1 protein NirF [Labrenzia sp. EL_208]
MNALRGVFLAIAISGAVFSGAAKADTIVATGDLGLVVERASGSLLLVDQSERAVISRIEGLGDLSHASLVYSPDQRYAYVFGRDGGLTKVDITEKKIVNRVVQSGNAIGGAISDDGRLVAVSNYEPGGVRIFDAETLDLVADIPTGSKTIGLVDAPGRKFVFTLWDEGETWIADLSSRELKVTKITEIGTNPYDALITGDGRLYIAGLFGEDGLTAIDLWDPEPKPIRVLPEYGRGQKDLPVYKMPHLEGWARAGQEFVLPAVGHHQVLWIDAGNLSETGRTDTYGQPVFAMSRPDGRQVWVNFAHPLNDTIQVIDTVSKDIVHEFKPGKAVLHMEFTPRGHEVWVSVRDAGKVMIYDTRTFEKRGEIDAESPSGIFFTSRAHRTGL